MVVMVVVGFVAVARACDDWLVKPPAQAARVGVSGDAKEIVLENGLIRRVIRIAPGAVQGIGTVAFDELTTNTSLLRAVKPEARVTIDGQEFPIGGLSGQPDRAFLRPEWLDALTPTPSPFRYERAQFSPIRPRFGWKEVRHSEGRAWPPGGRALALCFATASDAQQPLPGVTIDVHYEIYDGLPLLSKWLTIKNGDTQPHRIDRVVVEELALVEAESRVEDAGIWQLPNLTVVTDFMFNGMAPAGANPAVRWLDDPEYDTQVNYSLKTPCRLEVGPALGPAVTLPPGGSFESPRVFELVHDQADHLGDRERRGLAVRRMWRTLAPWCTENPLMLHLTTTEPAAVKAAIDQAAAVGFEMVIFSFGSGLDLEDASDANVAKFRALVEYAHSRKIELGGYSLLASRRIDDENDVIHPKTGKTGGAIFGNSPCLQSTWGRGYFDRVTRFLDATGFDLLEHDGSYPGDVCASTTHPGHQGLADSQWQQFAEIAAFYRRCRERGVYLNVPDFYFLNGSSKTGMGYRETNWSLPRAEQHLHARQHLFDGTWEKTQTAGWMFVPLTEYQGGGAAATIEPLSEHLDDYERVLVNCLGFGAQACYRGPRLYDGDATRSLVTKWVAWFKEHRRILEADVIHLRRPDGRDWDGVLHVDPTAGAGGERALAMLWNPLGEPIRRTIRLPLHYSGLGAGLGAGGRAGDATATASIDGGPALPLSLDHDAAAMIDVTIPAQGSSWIVVR